MNKAEEKLCDEIGRLVDEIADSRSRASGLVQDPPYPGHFLIDWDEARKIAEGKETLLPYHEAFVDHFWPGDPDKVQSVCKSCGTITKVKLPPEERGDWRSGNPLVAMRDAMAAFAGWLEAYYERSFLSSAGF